MSLTFPSYRSGIHPGLRRPDAAGLAETIEAGLIILRHFYLPPRSILPIDRIGETVGPAQIPTGRSA
jgi:hypothetical protein